MKTILLTGKPRCGKSFIVNEIVLELQGRGLKVGGILTPDIREDHAVRGSVFDPEAQTRREEPSGSRRERTGFHIIDIASGSKEILASKHLKKGPSIGPYHINVEGIDLVTGKFLENVDSVDIIIIDELGVMELKSERFKKMLDQILTSDKPKLIVLNRHLVRHYNRYGEVIEMKREMQEEIKAKILEKFTQIGFKT